MDFRFNKFCKNLNKNDKRIMTTMPKLMFNNELLVHTVQNFKVLNNFISLRFSHLIWVEYNIDIHK